MKTQITATVINGTLKLDQPIDLPDDSRVRIVVEPLADSCQRWATALEALQKLTREHPIGSGGVRYTREELHERR